jgi:hypothetical protein
MTTPISFYSLASYSITALKHGTEHLSCGELGYQLEVQSDDEVGDLARSAAALCQ